MAFTTWLAPKKVNTTDAPVGPGIDYDSQVVGLTNGNYIISWVYQNPEDSRYEVLGQLYSADGTTLGNELVLARGVLSFFRPSVAALANGGFAMAFDQIYSATDDDTRMQIFNASGVPLNGFDISLSSAVSTQAPNVLFARNGETFVFYQTETIGENNSNIVARLITSTGSILGELQVATSAKGEYNPMAVQLADDRLAIVYESAYSANDTDIVVKMMDPISGSITLTTIIENSNKDAYRPQIAALANGGYVVTYTVDTATSQSTNANYVVVDNTGGIVKTGSLAKNLDGPQDTSQIVALKGGGFYALWASPERDNFYGQQFDAAGARIGDPEVMPTKANYAEYYPSMALHDDGRIIVSYNHEAQNSDSDIAHFIIDKRGATINATSGDDNWAARKQGGTLNGLDGRDMLRGQSGVDKLNGGTGNDSLLGRANADILWGNAGADRLEGGLGDDKLTGGAGRDHLYGGAGSDVFQFTMISDSGKLTTSADIIHDFDFNDRISLAFIDAFAATATNDAFTYRGAQGFTSAGQVRLVQSGGDTRILLETTGDGVADLVIVVDGYTGLAKTDFIL